MSRRHFDASRLVRALAGAALLSVLVWHPAMAQDDEAEAAEPAAPSTSPLAGLRLMSLSRFDSVVSVARKQVGLKYRYGAERPGKAFDCSGLVRFVARSIGIELPRTAREQALQGDEVARDTAAMQPGDLVYFGKGARVSHIGIYVGEGRYVHAANRRKGVIESRLPEPSSRRWRWWKGVRRVLEPGSDDETLELLNELDPLEPTLTRQASLTLPTLQ